MDRVVVLVWGDGREERIRVAGDETILEAAERAGLALPFGCRRGACTTCTAHLRAGRVEHTRPPRGLRDHHRMDGYVLTCIAEPGTECRLRVGVQHELTPTPWRDNP